MFNKNTAQRAYHKFTESEFSEKEPGNVQMFNKACRYTYDTASWRNAVIKYVIIYIKKSSNLEIKASLFC